MTNLQNQLDVNPDGVFLRSRDESLTFAQVERRVVARARELGDRSGGQVVVRPRIDIDSVVELLAVSRAGATAVVISPKFSEAAALDLGSHAAGDKRPCHSVLFTSGTAGAPKGVRITAANWGAAARASIQALGLGVGDRWLCPLPLHHVGGLSIIYRSLTAGGTAVLARDLSEAAVWLDRVRFASLVPTQLVRVLEGRTEVLANRPTVLIGGGPSRPELLAGAESAGLVPLPTYGMTESTAQAATARPGDPNRRLFPLPGVEIDTDPDNRIRIRGAMVSPGYVGQPDRADGSWFTSSDLGRVEGDGSLVVIGRADRLIISGGEKVDPAEVEATLLAHPGVSEAAVFGMADDDWGERVAAAYAGDASSAELTAYVKGSLAAAAVPKQWLRIDRLPRTELGKVDVTTLVAQLLMRGSQRK